MPKTKKSKKTQHEDPKKELSRLKLLFRRIKIAGIFVGSLALIVVLAFMVYSFVYHQKMYYGVRVGSLNLAGKTKAQVSIEVKAASDEFLKQKLTLSFQEKKYDLLPAEISLVYNTSESADSIYSYARGNTWQDYWDRFSMIFAGRSLAPEYVYDQNAFKTKLDGIAKELDVPEKDYNLQIVGGQVSVTTERADGKRLDRDLLEKDLASRLDNFNKDNISLVVEMKKPEVTLENAQKAKTAAEAILAGKELKLTYADKIYPVDLDTIGNWIKATPNGQELALDLDRTKVSDYLSTVAASINVGSQDAMLSLVNGQVTISQPSRDGVTVDVDASVTKIVTTLLSRVSPDPSVDTTTLSLATTPQKPSVTSDALSTLGLTNLVGTATTSFTTSPANRITNITVGTRLISGALIKPGEIFSTLKRLGNIDASSGFLPELVIKNNRTVPDYGGGLCQVSTTLFRAAMNSGLDIVERQNHSYRVSYYEPPVGMDATIYDPAPDFRFKNDTTGYILVQGTIKGKTITFDFYGTKDGRTVALSTPVVTDVTPPGDPIMENTDTLPTGETKQVDHAHDGATASFTYTVMTKDGQQLHHNTFVSHYVPWPARFLVGTGPVAPTPTPPADPAATPTP